jgi:hypothetical protein
MSVGSGDILPMCPGYAMGSLIKKTELLLPILRKQEAELNDRLSQLSQLKGNNSSKEATNQFVVDKIKLQRNLNAVQVRIKAMEDSTASSLDLPQTLPADTSKMKIENRSFCFEKMMHVTLKKNDKTSNALQERIDHFAMDLLSHDGLSSYLPTSSLKQIANVADNMLTDREEISIVGSFVCVPRVRILDPLILRRNAVNKKLIRGAKDYCVLTEAVLGGVFFGIGNFSAKSKREAQLQSQPSSEEKQTHIGEENLIRAAMVSFISQGVIPKTSQDPENTDLWSVYQDWKKTMNEDPYSGYPIGFKSRELKDILRENGIEVSDSDDEKDETPKQ